MTLSSVASQLWLDPQQQQQQQLISCLLITGFGVVLSYVGLQYIQHVRLQRYMQRHPYTIILQPKQRTPPHRTTSLVATKAIQWMTTLVAHGSSNVLFYTVLFLAVTLTLIVQSLRYTVHHTLEAVYTTITALTGGILHYYTTKRTNTTTIKQSQQSQKSVRWVDDSGHIQATHYYYDVHSVPQQRVSPHTSPPPPKLLVHPHDDVPPSGRRRYQSTPPRRRTPPRQTHAGLEFQSPLPQQQHPPPAVLQTPPPRTTTTQQARMASPSLTSPVVPTTKRYHHPLYPGHFHIAQITKTVAEQLRKRRRSDHTTTTTSTEPLGATDDAPPVPKRGRIKLVVQPRRIGPKPNLRKRKQQEQRILKEFHQMKQRYNNKRHASHHGMPAAVEGPLSFPPVVAPVTDAPTATGIGAAPSSLTSQTFQWGTTASAATAMAPVPNPEDAPNNDGVATATATTTLVSQAPAFTSQLSWDMSPEAPTGKGPTTFQFGASASSNPSTARESVKPMFSFGAAPSATTAAPERTMPAFSLGATLSANAPEQDQAHAPTPPPPSTFTAPPPSFQFGSTAVHTPPPGSTTTSSLTAPPAPPAFAFGTQTALAIRAPPPPLTFDAQPPPSLPTFGSSNPTTTPLTANLGAANINMGLDNSASARRRAQQRRGGRKR